MAIAETIHRNVQRLPDPMQVEVLDFVEYLLAKAEREGLLEDHRQWPGLSVSLAMRGMEDEQGPGYDLSDLKEPFS